MDANRQKVIDDYLAQEYNRHKENTPKELVTQTSFLSLRVPQLVKLLIECECLGISEQELRQQLSTHDSEWLLDAAISREEALADAETQHFVDGQVRRAPTYSSKNSHAVKYKYGHVIYQTEGDKKTADGQDIFGHVPLYVWNKWTVVETEKD